jgi:hypothetical protein
MSNAIELAQGPNALIPVAELERMATIMAKSSLFGSGDKKWTSDQILSLMLIAQAEGLHPATAAQEYDIIQGKPALKSQSALARFQNAGGKITWITRTDAEATATFSHPQSSDVTVTWNMARAERMGLAGKDNWKKQPGIMLQWRTVAEGVRVCYPACLNRMYTVEEVQDMPPMRNVTPVGPEPVPSAPLEPTAEQHFPEGQEKSETTLESLKDLLKGYKNKIGAEVVGNKTGKTVHQLIDAMLANPKATKEDISSAIDWCEGQIQEGGA